MASPQSFVALPAELPRKGSRLEAILTADSARERARARRITLVSLLAVLGAPLFVAEVWPGRLSAELRSFAATGWALCFVAVLVALAVEWVWDRRRARHIAGLGPLPTLRSAHRPGAACAASDDGED